jgi:hypothetical protein
MEDVMQFSKSAMVSFLLLAAACSSTTTVTTTDGGTGTDAGKDVAVKDTGTTPDGSGGSCKPQDVSGFAPSTDPGPATAAGACTDQVALDYYNACIDPGDTTACTALGKDTTKAACLKCLSTPDTAAKWGALVEDSQNLIRNNIAGCLAVKGDAACAKAISESSQCTRAACPDTVCPVPDGDSAALDALNKCESDSEKLGCKKYADVALCADTTDGGTAAAKACTAPANSTDDFKDTYLAVAHVICVSGN